VFIIWTHRSTTYVHVVYCYRPSSVVCRSVCRSVTLVSPAKTAEPIEMPFELRTRVGPGNHVLDRIQIPHMKGQFSEGKGASHCKVYGHCMVICAKTTEPIEMPFGLWARMGLRNRVLDGVHIPRGKGQFWGKGAPIVKHRDFLP